MIIMEHYLEVFRRYYTGSNRSTDEAITQLKLAGATQMDCLKVIKNELHLSLPEADNIVLNSTAWLSNKEATVKFRNDFGNLLEEL
jgi:hypothetical protein